jgi:hypothetical protein
LDPADGLDMPSYQNLGVTVWRRFSIGAAREERVDGPKIREASGEGAEAHGMGPQPAKPEKGMSRCGFSGEGRFAGKGIHTGPIGSSSCRGGVKVGGEGRKGGMTE